MLACEVALPQKDSHHEDDHSGASVVAFRVDGLCLDLGTCLRTPRGNLGAGGSFTSSPNLVGATAAPPVGARTGDPLCIAMGNVEAERARRSVSTLLAGSLRQPCMQTTLQNEL